MTPPSNFGKTETLIRVELVDEFSGELLTSFDEILIPRFLFFEVFDSLHFVGVELFFTSHRN